MEVNDMSMQGELLALRAEIEMLVSMRESMCAANVDATRRGETIPFGQLAFSENSNLLRKCASKARELVNKPAAAQQLLLEQVQCNDSIDRNRSNVL